MTIAHNFSKSEMATIVEDMVLQILSGISFHKDINDFDIADIRKVRDIENDVPPEFCDRFFLLMDVLAPAHKYARSFIRREHPDVLFLFNCLWRLYTNRKTTDCDDDCDDC